MKLLAQIKLIFKSGMLASIPLVLVSGLVFAQNAGIQTPTPKELAAKTKDIYARAAFLRFDATLEVNKAQKMKDHVVYKSVMSRTGDIKSDVFVNDQWQYGFQLFTKATGTSGKPVSELREIDPVHKTVFAPLTLDEPLNELRHAHKVLSYEVWCGWGGYLHSYLGSDSSTIATFVERIGAGTIESQSERDGETVYRVKSLREAASPPSKDKDGALIPDSSSPDIWDVVLVGASGKIYGKERLRRPYGENQKTVPELRVSFQNIKFEETLDRVQVFGSIPKEAEGFKKIEK